MGIEDDYVEPEYIPAFAWMGQEAIEYCKKYGGRKSSEVLPEKIRALRKQVEGHVKALQDFGTVVHRNQPLLHPEEQTFLDNVQKVRPRVAQAAKTLEQNRDERLAGIFNFYNGSLALVVGAFLMGLGNEHPVRSVQLPLLVRIPDGQPRLFRSVQHRHGFHRRRSRFPEWVVSAENGVGVHRCNLSDTPGDLPRTQGEPGGGCSRDFPDRPYPARQPSGCGDPGNATLGRRNPPVKICRKVEETVDRSQHSFGHGILRKQALSPGMRSTIQ